MSVHFLTARRWVLALMTGVPVGVAVALFTSSFAAGGWVVAVGCGALGGAAFGLTMAGLARGQREIVRTAAGDLPAATLVAAHRAARGGPVPADPEIRSAATKIAVHQLTLLRRNSGQLLLLVMPLTSLSLFGLTTPMGWPTWFTAVPALLAALSATMFAIHMMYSPKRLRDRIRLLSANGTTPAP